VEKPYHVVEKDSNEELGRRLVKNGQVPLPMMELIEQSKMAVDESSDVLGRAQIAAVLRLSAEAGVGPLHPGKKGGHRLARARGSHGLSEGEKARGEAAAAAEERPGRSGRSSHFRLRSDAVGQEVGQPMVETVGVSHSSVSWEAGDAGRSWIC
jgi:hypothetical protein